MRTQGEPDWQDQAACLTTDPDVFFPQPTERALTKWAVGVCNGCDVQAQCLQYALEREEVYGIWGGTTEIQRRAMRKRAKRQSA